MRCKNTGTVLIYTMVLVVLGVFMATVILNIAVQLSSEYDKRNIEVSLMGIIETKGDLAMKHSREVNNSGSGFSDVVSCPENISMSGSSVLDGDIDTSLRYFTGAIVCLGTHDNGEELIINFNSDFDDIAFANFEGYQIAISSSNLTGTFGDSDNSFLDLGTSAYLTSDGIDDDFDSDNYSSSSTGSTYFPDGYTDNDARARKLIYGYVIQNSGLNNVFWSNTEMKDYIAENPYNNDGIFPRLGQVGSGYLDLDINANHRLVLYRIDPLSYNDSYEIIVEEIIYGSGQLAGIGYLQDDLSLSSSTGSAYDFDFINNDYALFIENTSTGTLLYQIQGEESTSRSDIYLNPLKDNDTSIFSFLGSHLLIDEEGRIFGDQFEIFGLK